jgi:hypothetical protein
MAPTRKRGELRRPWFQVEEQEVFRFEGDGGMAKGSQWWSGELRVGSRWAWKRAERAAIRPIVGTGGVDEVTGLFAVFLSDLDAGRGLGNSIRGQGKNSSSVVSSRGGQSDGVEQRGDWMDREDRGARERVGVRCFWRRLWICWRAFRDRAERGHLGRFAGDRAADAFLSFF